MANDIIEEIQEAVEEGLEKLEEVVEEIVGDKLDEVKEGTEEIKEDVEEAVQESVEEVEEVAEEIVDPVKLEKEAEAESTDEKKVKTLEEKKKEILAKVKKLKSKLKDVPKTEDLKAQVKLKKKTDMLIPLEEYVKAGIYLGTKVVTPAMKKYIYRRRADGLAIFNTDTIDEKLKEGVEFLTKFEAKDIILICKRQAGWRVAEKFAQLTGIRVFTKKYPAGILTNTSLPNFLENELTIVTDQWIDKNALVDTLKVHKKVLMICDTNNFSKGADQIIIGNNKSPKSLGVIFYLLAKGYCKAKKIDVEVPELEWWTQEVEEKQVRAKFGV